MSLSSLRSSSICWSLDTTAVRLHARVRALARCVRDQPSLSRGHRRRGREPTYSRSRRVVIRVSFVSAVDTTCANADTSRTSGVRPETARRTSIVYSSYNISSHRPRQRRRRRRAHARRVKCRSCSPTTRVNFISTNVAAVASRARSSRASSKSPNARVASTGIRGGLDRSMRRRSIVTRLVSFSFSRARPHRHLFRRRSRARVQRSLCFKRERCRHRTASSSCARATRHLIVEVRRIERGVRFRNDDLERFGNA